MAMEFKAKEVAAISKLSSLNEKAVRRVLGSLTIVHIRGEKKNNYNLGLRLNESDLRSEPNHEANVDLISEVLRKFRNLCPQVLEWIGRGDFKANDVPDNVTRALLIHSCRTAGRLRAELMRKLS